MVEKLAANTILEAIESSLRILSGLQAGQQPSEIDLKNTINENRMARLILTRRQ